MKKTWMAVVGAIFCQTTLASQIFKPDTFFLGSGVFNAKQGKELHIDITGLIGDQYLISSDHSSSAFVTLGALWKVKAVKQGTILIGLDYSFFGNTKTKGDILIENTLRNLSYSYSAHSSVIISSAQLRHSMGKSGNEAIFEIGLGPNFMTTHGYSEQSLDDTTSTSKSFKGKTTPSLAARVGVSLLTKNLSKTKGFSLGYRLTSLGSGKLKPNTGNITSQLTTGNVYNHAIMLSVFL